MRVVGFGTYDQRKHPRIGIVLDGLREHGVEVTEVNEPLGFSTAERVAMLGKPWLRYRFALRLLARWWTLIRRSLRRRGVDAVVIGYLGHFDVILARALYPRTTIVLDMLIFAADTARDRGVSGGARLRLLRLLDSVAAACANLILVDTQEHLELLPAGSRDKGVVVPVGAPREWFVAGTADHDDSPLQVIFYGLFTPLQGARVVGEALGLLADHDYITVTMIGTGQDYEAAHAAALANPNVTWIDWVESGSLAALVADHDVCLGIFGATPKALRVVPNKVYQGAAAGCAIITSDTAPQHRALGEAALYTVPGDARMLADAISELAQHRQHLDELRALGRNRASTEFGAGIIVSGLLRRLTEIAQAVS